MLKNAHIWSMDAALMRALAQWLGARQSRLMRALFEVPLEEKFRLAVEPFAVGS